MPETQPKAVRLAGRETALEQMTKGGIKTKPLYVKHMALEIWEMLAQIKAAQGFKTDADALRWAISKAAGRI